MLYQGEELVRVASRLELKAGILVIELACYECGRQHAFVLLKIARPGGGEHLNGSPCQVPAWEVSPCGCLDEYPACFCGEIREGRLYRLQEPPAEVNDYGVVAAPTKAKAGAR